MTKTVDYSWTYVGADAIAGAGYVGAERYLGNDGRCLTAGERDELLAEGIGIGLIWETQADRSLDGYWAGYNDAVAANDYADGLGAPVLSIWYATDFHAQPNQIAGPITDYYRGAKDFGGRPVRVYGGAPVIDEMANMLSLTSGWQAAAASWSDYRLSPNACLLQEVEQVWGGAADTNAVLCPDDEIDWLWGHEGDWLDMASRDEVAQVVRDELNRQASHLYTGSRWLRVQGDDRVFDIVDIGGVRYKRWAGPDEVDTYMFVDSVAGAPGVDGPRVIDPATNPDHARYAGVLNALPWLHEQAAA